MLDIDREGEVKLNFERILSNTLND